MSGYTILYVDDDMDDLMIISDAFEKYTDYLRVIHACDGVDALNKLEDMTAKNTCPCLIILDINMPVMDGKETLKVIKSTPEYNDIPVVIFSTSASDRDKKFAEDLGADFITKPVQYTHLEELVHAFVEKCRFESRVRLESQHR